MGQAHTRTGHRGAFGDHRKEGAPFLRFTFCKRTSVLEEAVGRLKTFGNQGQGEGAEVGKAGST